MRADVAAVLLLVAAWWFRRQADQSGEQLASETSASP